MSEKEPGPVAIPARISVGELAVVLGISIGAVQTALEARGEPWAAGDILGPEISVAVAAQLGYPVSVEARDLALESLYELEVHGAIDIDELPIRTARLVSGVIENLEPLDREIEEASEHWSVARMPLVDRTILRLGLYELRWNRDTPTAVVVSEAVRLAKTYSTERSGSFVNGVLASLARVRD